jgi:hypothetical protein
MRKPAPASVAVIAQARCSPLATYCFHTASVAKFLMSKSSPAISGGEFAPGAPKAPNTMRIEAHFVSMRILICMDAAKSGFKRRGSEW